MASIKNVIFWFLATSLILNDVNANQVVTIKCSSSEFKAQFGNRTLLDCVLRSTDSEDRVREITWTFNGKEVLEFYDRPVEPKDSRFQFAESLSLRNGAMNVSLLITNTWLNDTGDFSCAAVTEKGHNKAKVHLKVTAHYSKPVIVLEPATISPNEGFSLTCNTQGPPQGHIRWVVNDCEWKSKAEEGMKKTHGGLYNLTSKLSFKPNSVFTKFVCEVHNTTGKEGQSTFEIPILGHNKGPKPRSESTVSHIVAPVVVIGSLIVGLLVAVLVMCRRRHQNMPLADYPEEINKMVETA